MPGNDEKQTKNVEDTRFLEEFEVKKFREHFLKDIKLIQNPAILIRKNADGSYETVFVTESFAKMTECSEEEALERMNGDGFILSIYPEDRIYVRKMLRRRISEDGTTELTIRQTTAAGNIIWCNVRYAFIDDFFEHYIYCTYFDVSMMKEYEARLKSAYMSMGDNFYHASERTLGMFRVNLSGDVIEDMQGKSLYGTDSLVLPYSEVMQQRAVNYPIKAEQEKLLSVFGREHLIENYNAGRVKESLTLFSRRIGGRHCFVTMTARITRHPMTGDVIAFISEEENNQGKVRETLMEQILVRQFDMVSYLADGEYGVIIGDASLIEKGSIFPLTREGNYIHYLDTQVVPVLHGTEAEIEEQEQSLRMETVERELEKKNPYVANIAVDIDGSTYFKRFDFYRINPEADFYIVLKSDTTDIQREQIEINEQLKLALEEAKQASIAKTAFLSRMSHEIRTPMNAIIGLDNIALKDSTLTESVEGYLEKIGGSARYLLSLINDILDMSRIESGRMVIKKEEFLFSNFLDQIRTIVDGQCRDKGLNFKCLIRGELDEYYIGDDTKLKQVLINILGNSVKFTNPGGTVFMGIEKIASYENQSTLKFSLQDTGIGMDKEYLPKIFEAFSQEDATTTSKYGGSGLGLAITQNIIELMNGRIKVDSTKGVGTTFTVEVTLQNVDKKDIAREFDIQPQDLHILIIDDNPVDLRHAQIMLEEIGITSEICRSGKEAIEMIQLAHARREEYNLILVDWKMPEQDGVEVTRKIREMLGSDTTVVILTSYNWTEVEKEAREAGVDAFMAKPIFANSVLNEFKQAIQRRKKIAEGEKQEADLRGRRILVAEDVEVNAIIMQELLSMGGMESEVAENGQIAVAKFNEHPEGYFDAILMDVRMPVMDGLEATRSLRALDRPDSKKIPIIAMTANAFDEDVQNSLHAGMNAHLAKPVEPDHLYKTLAEIIGKYSRER